MSLGAPEVARVPVTLTSVVSTPDRPTRTPRPRIWRLREDISDRARISLTIAS
jgi:hypothetical protein